MRLPLALLLGATLLLAPTASSLLAVSPSRFDLDTLPPGGAFEGHVEVTNKGAESTRVEIGVHALEGEEVSADPRDFTLAPGETRPLLVRLALPANVSGGRHDPRLELVEAPVEGGAATVGRAAVSVPLVFWVQNLKVGNLEVRHPLGGEDGEARILVQNFLGEPVAADVLLRVLDARGAEVARGEGRTARTDANASTSLNLTLPTAALAPGSYVVRGEASHEGFGSNAWALPLFVGERRLSVGDATVETLPGGRVVFTARVGNVGTVPLPGVVTFEYGLVGQPSRSVSADGGLLAPGESKLLRAEATLPPGAYDSRALVHWTGGKAEAPGMAFSFVGPEGPAQTPLPVAVLLLGLLVAARLRRR